MKFRIEEYRLCKKCGKKYFAVGEDERDWNSQFCSAVCFEKSQKRDMINTHKINRKHRDEEYGDREDER